VEIDNLMGEDCIVWPSGADAQLKKITISFNDYSANAEKWVTDTLELEQKNSL